MHYPENLIIGQLNINSIRSKFSAFKEFIQRKRISYYLQKQNLLNIFLIHRSSLKYRGVSKRSQIDGEELFLYITEKISSTLANIYHCSKESDVIALEFSISNK